VTLPPPLTGEGGTSSAEAGEPVTQRVAPTAGIVTGSAEPAAISAAISAGVIRGVSLVGGGPGDPDLLTLRAEALLAEAAAVVVDAGVDHLAAAFAPDAALVRVPDRMPAVDILLAAARSGRGPVVRLYAGDTWLHPGHGAEADALAAAGIRFSAFAGVATEVAVAGMAGIPVHLRHLAVACTIAPAGGAPPATDPARTLVMVVDDLHAAALAMATTGETEMPAAAIETSGPVTRAALGDLAASAPRRPGVLIAGAVAGARSEPGTAVATG